MKFSTFLLGAASAAVLSSAASAADLPARVVKPGIAPAAAGCFWQGPYVGAHVGYTWAKFDNNLQVNDGPIVLPPVGEQKHQKVTGGGYAGYNFCVTPSLIVGLEADFTKYGHHKNYFGTGGGNFYGADFDANWGGSLRARIGLPFDRFLVYATGGLAGVQLSTETFRSLGGAGTVAGVSGSKFALGYAVGGGLEYAFTQNFVGRVEYIYTDLGTYSVGNSKASASFNTIRVGLGYKF